jgi:DNA gyrase subunit A
MDLEKNTVDMQPNFDDTLEEPTVLPTRVPLLLVNGSSGIAVGMATNMAPHNLGEVIDGCIAFIDQKGDITISELMNYIKAPDFPTGCTIYGMEGVREGYETGRGRVIMRGDSTVEEDDHGRQKIVVVSLPYMVNKAEMIKRTAELINEKKIEGISDIRDESDRNGIRIVYDIKRDAMADVVLNKLYKQTALQSTFGINNIALVKGRPQTLNIKDLIHYFIEHRIEIVIRRSQFDLDKAEKRAHIIEGLLKAIDIIDEIISLIRASQTPDDAKIELMEKYGFSDEQAAAILSMRLRALSGLERQKLQEEMEALQKEIDYLRKVLSDEDLRMEIIKNELIEIKEKYNDPRRSAIEYSSVDFNIEDTISNEDVVVTISHVGYIKRTPLREYRVQARGGRGSRGSDVRTDDFVEHLFTAMAHNYMLLFTAKGKCYWMRVFEIPEGNKTSKGRAIQNLINIEDGDKVMAFINVKSLKEQEYIDNNYILMCTKKGILKKTSLEAYSRPRQNGINAITIREGDELLQACLTNGNNIVLLANKGGRAIRFPEKKVRAMGRTASGVRGMTLDAKKEDEIIGMICVEDDEDVLVVSENGYGKRSALKDYRETNRGGKGVKTINITEKTGDLIAIKNVNDEDDLMIINRSGVTIRSKVVNLRVMGRATQGVRLINLKDDDVIAGVCKVPSEDEEIIIEDADFVEENDEIKDQLLQRAQEDSKEQAQNEE